MIAAAIITAPVHSAEQAPEKNPPAEDALRPLIQFPGVHPGGDLQLMLFADQALQIRYGAEAKPETFRAALNGKDVTSLFNPATETREEAVNLPLAAGYNLLRIEVNSRKVAADPRSALLPQEHLLKIKLDPVAGNVATDEVRRFSTMEEAKAYVKKQGEAPPPPKERAERAPADETQADDAAQPALADPAGSALNFSSRRGSGVRHGAKGQASQ